MDTLEHYLRRLIVRYQTLAHGIFQNIWPQGLPLDEIYVPLTVRIEAGMAELPENLHDAELQHQLLQGQESKEPQAEMTGRERYWAKSASGLTIERLWKYGQQWVLLGGPGAGKTTLLHYLALTHARALQKNMQVRLPIYINLESFAHFWQTQPHYSTSEFLPDSILQYLQQVGGEVNFSPSHEDEPSPQVNTQLADILQQALQEHRALLLFDGLDSIHDAALRDRCCGAIHALLQRFPGNRCLLTARPISYRPGLLGNNFRIITLEAFTPLQTRRFFQQWLRLASPKTEEAEASPATYTDSTLRQRIQQQTEALVSCIDPDSDRLFENLSSPLLCTLLGLIQQQNQTLPRNQADLYRLYITLFIQHGFIHTQHTEAVNSALLNIDEIREILEDIALYIQENRVDNRVPLQNILEVVKYYLEQRQPVSGALENEQKLNLLQDLIKQNQGLLIHYGQEEYGFFHLTFQEYLAACAITRNPVQIDHYLQRYLFNPHWQGIIRLAAAHQGMLSESLGSAFITMIQRYPHVREADMHYAFRIAFHCLRDTQVSLQTADQMFQTGVHLYLTHPALQPALIRLLRQVQNLRYTPAAIQPLFHAISHPEAVVRAKTTELLGLLRDEHALQVLMLCVQKDSHALVRGKAAEALGLFQQETDAAPLLLKTLKEDRAFYVRQYAAHSLAKIDEGGSFPALLAAVEDTDPLIRARMAEALGCFGRQEAVPFLVQLLSKDTSSSVRWRAAEALGNLKEPLAIAPLLQSLKNENSPVVRGRAAEALGYFKSETVIKKLLEALEQDHYPAVRWRAAESLGYLQNNEAVPSLLHALKKDPDSSVRWSAAKALGQIKEPVSLAMLLKVAREDKDPSVRWSAAEALGQLHQSEAVPVLLQILEYEAYPLVRGKACEALGHLNEPSITPMLLQILSNDAATSVRAQAAVALGRLQDPSALMPLMSAVQHDKQAKVRWSAAEALGNLKNPAAIPVLLQALHQDTELTVSWQAAQALELIDLGGLL
ncbi:HEAT repeat domain-containing protein [Candidatus Venteria ishoeyi]|uniref:Putative phycocyanin operon protein Z n=1 Tax=Candidatus Venteria ishoeyi TaxID=1899563 RepID=A0A1H6F569_9GAMM|nr:HEAT repeat domain-containing protein [Candidatus Venteria ishoeyi]MDM8547581.1 HEAT repeat domain-containing protein [Candidatus Venteria ishoeyi]SEH04531.1 putative phycocyanin operon protein Z [Candidatus Venteria ishoeyi]